MSRGKYSEAKAILRLFISTVGLLGFLAAANVLIILDSLGHEVFKPLTRNIASVQTVAPAEEKAVPSPLWTVDCSQWKKSSALKTQALSARLTFKNCGSIQSLKNVSNHSSGDLFPLNNGHITTDYISLEQGSNSITVDFDNSSKTLVITRELLNATAKNKEL